MFSKETYLERRAQLARKMQGKGLILFPGHVESPMNYPENTYRFRQDSNFLYYFGLSLPNLAATIDTDTGVSTLYGDDFSIDDIVWMGAQPKVSELGANVGVQKTAPLSALADTVAAAVAKGRRVHFLPPYRGETKLLIDSILPGAVPSEDLIRAVVSMRDKKSAEEIAEIEKACDIGYQMHTLAMRMCAPGVTEKSIAGAIEGVAWQQGWSAFPSIVTQHGEILHNHTHNGILQAGRLMVVDAGAEPASGYACDFTRTVPISGKFTSRQKDIYDIVLAANNHAFDIAAPGVRNVDVHMACSKVLIEGLHSLGFVRGSVDDAVDAGVAALFMPHGLGHLMGLDVHDMEDLGEDFVGYDDETPRSTHPSGRKVRMGRRLQTGMVLTVEPGLYFVPDLIAKWKAEGTCAEFIDFAKVDSYIDFGGCRIEDDMLITADGNRLLGSRRIPATTAEVEAEVAKGAKA